VCLLPKLRLWTLTGGFTCGCVSYISFPEFRIHQMVGGSLCVLSDVCDISYVGVRFSDLANELFALLHLQAC
jgi:hypothetical protein